MNLSPFPAFSPFFRLRCSMFNVGCSMFLFLLSLWTLDLGLLPSPAATIIGNLTDISLQPLDTRISFAPTNQVTVTGGGLSVRPPRLAQTPTRSFSPPPHVGDYTGTPPLPG